MIKKLHQLRYLSVLAVASLAGVTAAAYFAGVMPSEAGLVRKLERLFGPEGQHAVTATGQVTYCDRDRGILFLQSSRGAWRVETAEIEKSIVLGGLVEASGIAPGELGSSLIQAATLKLLRAGEKARPQTATAAELANTTFDNRFISITGKVLETRAERLGQLDLVIQVDREKIEARISEWSGLIPAELIDAKVIADGVLDRTAGGCVKADCSVLLLGKLSDLHVIGGKSKIKGESDQRGTDVRRPLTHVADIHRLAALEAEQHLPVKLTGVVTVATSRYMFIQDETGGVYVDGANGGVEHARTGERVVVTGLTGAGQFAPVVVRPHIELTTAGTLPTARQPDLSRVISGSEDSNWIEIDGIVRAATWERSVVYLRAEINGVAYRIAITGARELPEHLVDAKVRLRGVCATEFNRLRQLVGFYILTPSIDFIRVLEPPKAPVMLPLRRISEFGSFSSNLLPGHRERVQGTVTFRSPSFTYVQDSSGSLQVQPVRATDDTRVGDRVEVTGFSTPKAFGPSMLEGVIRNIGRGITIQPRKTTAEQVLNQGAEGELVTLEATLFDRVPSNGGEVLIMHAGHRVFTGRLENMHAPKARIGSLLQLIGIPVLQARRGHPYVPSGFSLLLGSPESVQVVREAAWWNARLVLWAIVLVALAAALIMFWAVLLRKQVLRQTSVIQLQLDEAEHLRAAAESAARLKSEFLANMSHEIRTPLNGILGMTDLALTEKISPVVRDYLETARESGGSLLQIINDVLDLSKIEAGHMKIERIAFDLEKCIRDAAAILRPAAAAKCIELELLFPESAPRCFEGDPSRIRQIVLNLLGNAVKFTEVGGAKIAVNCQPMENNVASVRVEVRDTGIGIPVDKQGSLFQSFTQADASTTRKYGGTGLGLAISKHLVQLMRGKIGLESEYGCGSTFWFELPLALADTPQPSTGATEPKKAANEMAATGCILVAEDNTVNQKLARRLLERMGFAVHSASDGNAAINAVQHSRFDAVLMDCQMPVCDGYEATAAIRSWEAGHSRSRTPIIALTAHALPGDRERCLQSGMDDYLTKPLRADELRNALNQWIQTSGRTPVA